MRTGVRRRVSGVRKKALGSGCWGLGVWLVTCHLSLVAPAFGGTHVTATYDLGANPRVMATVNGHAEYGLVFAERNKLVTYGGVEYGPNVVKGYLDASGQLNDGGGNLWLDLIPNLGATPGDSFYVVTFNIQGRIHAEIWVVPDVATVGADICRQSQAPSSNAPALYYQFLQQAGEDLPQRQKLNFTGTGVSCLDNAGQLRTDCTISGGGGSGSAPLASPTVSGTVKIDAPSADPLVYLKSSSDTLLAGKASSVHTHSENDVTSLTTDLAGKAPLTHAHSESEVTNLVTDLDAKVPTSRTVSTSSPLSGGGALSSNLALSCPTCEVTGNKNAASGYAGLTASSKLNLSEMQEVMAAADLSDLSGLFGSAPGTKAATTALAGDPSTDNCVKWIAGGKLGDAGQACGTGGGGGDNISVNGTVATDADFDDSTPAAPSNSINVKWQKDSSTPNNLSAYLPYAAPLTVSSGNLTTDSSVVRGNQANTYSTGAQDFGSASSLKVPVAAGAAPTVNGQIAYDSTANEWKVGEDSATRMIVDVATTGLASGSIVVGAGSYGDVNDSGVTIVAASGSAGVGPRNAGNASSVARSDHDHRSIHALSWFFPGTPASGVQNMTLTLPEGIANPAITDLRVTVNTTSGSSSTFNIQRCTASCTGASPTFGDIYSAALTLNASTRTVAKGSAPNQSVSGLAAGDQFKANLVTIGSSLADVTVTMTVKHDTTN